MLLGGERQTLVGTAVEVNRELGYPQHGVLAVPATSHDHTVVGRHVHTLTLTAIRRRWVPDQAVLEL